MPNVQCMFELLWREYHRRTRVGIEPTDLSSYVEFKFSFPISTCRLMVHQICYFFALHHMPFSDDAYHGSPWKPFSPVCTCTCRCRGGPPKTSHFLHVVWLRTKSVIFLHCIICHFQTMRIIMDPPWKPFSPVCTRRCHCEPPKTLPSSASNLISGDDACSALQNSSRKVVWIKLLKWNRMESQQYVSGNSISGRRKRRDIAQIHFHFSPSWLLLFDYCMAHVFCRRKDNP